MIPVLDGGPSPDAARTLLDEALHAAVFTAEDLDQAYADGKEDLAAKLAELIGQSDFEIDNHSIMRFLEAEIGYSEDAARWTRAPDRSTILEYDPNDRSPL